MTSKDIIEACDILIKLEQEFSTEESKLSEVSNDHAIRIDELDQQISTFRRNEDVDFRVFSPRNVSTGTSEKIAALEDENYEFLNFASLRTIFKKHTEEFLKFPEFKNLKDFFEKSYEVSKEKLQKFCDDRNIQGFEVSAKIGKNLSECFEALAKLIVGDKTKDELIQTYTIVSKGRGVSINSKKKDKKDKKKCC